MVLVFRADALKMIMMATSCHIYSIDSRTKILGAHIDYNGIISDRFQKNPINGLGGDVIR